MCFKEQVVLVSPAFAPLALQKETEQNRPYLTRHGKIPRDPRDLGPGSPTTTGLSSSGRAMSHDKVANVPGQVAPKNMAKWFGAALADATNKSSDIPWGGGGGENFPGWLREVMEPHIVKCRKTRDDALNLANEETRSRDWWDEWKEGGWPPERDVQWDPFAHDLRGAFCEATGCTGKLDAVHEEEGLKDAMLAQLSDRARNYAFQQAYDEFVRDVVAPIIQDMCDCGGTIYYQAFPCVRVVRPGDFSIGPHADCNYGHSPASINIYLPLTDLYGSNALYIESKSGKEDWHPIEGDYGYLKVFHGGICTHWTTENHTPSTRVSIDFRAIPGTRWVPGGWSTKDTFARGGYYAIATRGPEGRW